MSDNVQEKDMEGILSSIKGILEEDEKRQQEEISKAASDNSDDKNILDRVLNSTEEDVIDLSPDMRIDKDFDDEFINDDILIDINELLVGETSQIDDGETKQDSEAAVTAETSVAEEEVVGNSEPIEDIVAPNEPFFEASETTEDVVAPNEPFFEAPDDKSIDLLLEEPAPVVEAPVAVAEEPTPVIEAPVAVAEEPAPVIEAPVAVAEEPTPVVEAPVAVAEEPTPVVEAPVAVAEEPTPVVEAPVIALPDRSIPVVQECNAVNEEANTATEAQTQEAVNGEDQNISSNIISSFAKMLTHEETFENTPIKETGNTSKTLEDLVVDAIQKAIGNEISAKWNKGRDFNAFVEAEVRRQVEEWITNNMRETISDIVKKEVERVMVKVGS